MSRIIRTSGGGSSSSFIRDNFDKVTIYIDRDTSNASDVTHTVNLADEPVFEAYHKNTAFSYDAGGTGTWSVLVFLWKSFGEGSPIPTEGSPAYETDGVIADNFILDYLHRMFSESSGIMSNRGQFEYSSSMPLGPLNPSELVFSDWTFSGDTPTFPTVDGGWHEPVFSYREYQVGVRVGNSLGSPGAAGFSLKHSTFDSFRQRPMGSYDVGATSTDTIYGLLLRPVVILPVGSQDKWLAEISLGDEGFLLEGERFLD